MKRYFLLSMASGCVWGLIAYVLSMGAFGQLVRGGLVAAPLIGLLIGMSYLPAYRLPRWAQALLSLATLYGTATLFGMAIGVYDALRPIPNRGTVEVVYQQVIAAVLGITFTGYLLLLWPLAFLNHRLLRHVLGPAH